MATTFVLHPFNAEQATDELSPWPTWGYTSWTHELITSRRDGTSPTLDVAVEAAPVTGDDDWYSTAHSFTQVTSGTGLPETQTNETTFGSDIRYQRISQTIGGSGAEWIYKLTATVTLFNTADSSHTDLLSDNAAGYSNLSDLAGQAEDDVVRRYTEAGRLALLTDEETGLAIREAIARRIEWLLRLKVLHDSARATDVPLLRRHIRVEWEDVDAALRNHDDRTPLLVA